MSNLLPSDFLLSVKDVKGFNEDEFLRAHQSPHPAVSVRLNSNKNITADKTSLNIEQSVPWSSMGYYLKERPSFTLDPLFHAGAYYVQEASSMFLEEVMKQTCELNKDISVLDLCAAPGGKSTLIQSLISNNSLLVSNEVIKSRVNILSENITKWGATNVIVTNNDPADFGRLNEFFEVIVTDAPCSGSGLFRKDPAAIDEWSLENVQMCSRRQERILNDVLPSLKKDGILIYSTCSFSKEENENMLDKIMKEHEMESIQISLNENWNIVETTAEVSGAFGYRFFPDKLKGEGFFIAAFRKIHEDGNSSSNKSSSKLQAISKSNLQILSHWIDNNPDYTYFNHKETIIAIPATIISDIQLVQSALYIRKAGVKLGNIIRDEFIPEHELAMSCICSNNITAIEVEENVALQYLRREEIHLESDKTGWQLICFKGLPLGWVKILPKRTNNYYPKEWRILYK
jgi:NOL1/NOP2/sun family putative RNA methylase